jgi:hypothetical protein
VELIHTLGRIRSSCKQFPDLATGPILRPNTVGKAQSNSTQRRPLNVIAAEIKRDWGIQASEYAAPYVNALSELRTAQDRFLKTAG